MTERDIEMKLKKAVEACTPDVLDKVIAGCNEQNIGNVVLLQKRKTPFRKFVAIAAAFAVVVGIGAFGFLNQTSNRIVSTVAFDVNPSIELKLNKKEEVVSANALNGDGKKILAGMKLDGVDARTATNAIVGSLLKNGYIDELANSLLLSVEDDDAAHGEKLQTELENEINAILSGASVNASVLSQYVNGNDVDGLSKQYQISHGKAALVKQIVAANRTYHVEELVTLSVNELNLILSNSKNKVTGVRATGTASDSAYIGSESAKTAALKHAGVVESDIRDLEIEMDYEQHCMVYEVEFNTANGEYEYDIDAKTGEVVLYQGGGQGATNPGHVDDNDDDWYDDNDRYDDDDDDRYDDDDDDRYDDDDDDRDDD